MGPLIPLFWTSGDICPGFQSQGGSLACCLTWVILRFTSGVTPADCIEVSMAAEPFRSIIIHEGSLHLIIGGKGRSLSHNYVQMRRKFEN